MRRASRRVQTAVAAALVAAALVVVALAWLLPHGDAKDVTRNAGTARGAVTSVPGRTPVGLLGWEPPQDRPPLPAP